MRARLKVSRAGVELIKSFEGLRTTAARLPDGRWTLGYGHTFSARDGATVTQEDADALLRFDLLPIVDAINNLVLTPINQNQFDALVSFCFNIGVDNFAASTVLKRINEGKMTEAALAMDSWRSAEFNGQTYVLAPLIRRRAAEKNLFLTPDDAAGNAPSLLVRPVEDAADAPAHPAEIEAPASGGILSARPMAEAPPAPVPGPSFTTQAFAPPFEISATPEPVPAPAAPAPERQVIDLNAFAPRAEDAAPAKPTIQLVAEVSPSVPVPGVVEQSPTAYDYDPTPAMSPEVQAALFRAQEEQRAAEALAQEQRLQEEARLQAEAMAAARLAEENRQRDEMRRREEERLQELQRQEMLRLEAERQERERLDRERQERERAEREAMMRAELARLDQERAEQARLEQQRLDTARAEAARLEAERLEQTRLEQARLEQARLEQERLEMERAEAARLEAARLDAERIERERQEAARVEAERAEQARIEAYRLEAERQERERVAREQEEAARREAEAAERARAEQVRLERERQERERQAQAAAAAAKPVDEDAEKARKAEAAAALMRLYSPYGSGSLGKPLTPAPARAPEPAPQPPVQPQPAQPQPMRPQAMVTPQAPKAPEPEPEPARLSVPEPEDDEDVEFAGGASFTPFQPVQSPSTMPPPTVTALNPYARPIQKAETPKAEPAPVRDVLVEVPRPAAVNPSAPSIAPFVNAQPEAPAQAPHWREQLNRPLPDVRPAQPEQSGFMRAQPAAAAEATVFNDDDWTFDGDRVALSNEDDEEDDHPSVWRMFVSTAWWFICSCFGLVLLGVAAALYWRGAFDPAAIRNGNQTDLMWSSVALAAAGIFFVCVSVWLILKRLGGLKD